MLFIVNPNWDKYGLKSWQCGKALFAVTIQNPLIWKLILIILIAFKNFLLLYFLWLFGLSSAYILAWLIIPVIVQDVVKIALRFTWSVLIVCIFNFVLILPYLFMYLKILNSDPDKHYLMYEHERVPIAVCEKEPSSIIAFALRYYS